MNFYNNYPFYPGGIMASPKTGLFSAGLLKNKISWGAILSNTGKAINVANQAIPAIKQVTPVYKNMKTMFKVMNEFKKVDAPNNSKIVSKSNSKQNVNHIQNEDTSIQSNNGPTFFI